MVNYCRPGNNSSVSSRPFSPDYNNNKYYYYYNYYYYRPFSPTNGSDHVKTSMKFGSQYG